MKKLMFVLLIVSIIVLKACPVMAGAIEVNVNDNIVEEEKFEQQDVKFDVNLGKIKGNGGPIVTMAQLDLTDLNGVLENEGFAPLKEDFVLFGFGGLGGTSNGSRFGFYGVEGKEVKSSGNSDEYRKAVLKFNYGGFLYEKGVFYQPSTNTDISLGAIMGGGNMNLNLYYQSPGNSMEETIRGGATGTSFKKEFIMLRPQITLHQQLASFVGLDVTVGYLLSYDVNDNWICEEKTMSGPLNNFQAPTIDVKLAFGF